MTDFRESRAHCCPCCVFCFTCLCQISNLVRRSVVCEDIQNRIFCCFLTWVGCRGFEETPRVAVHEARVRPAETALQERGQVVDAARTVHCRVTTLQGRRCSDGSSGMVGAAGMALWPERIACDAQSLFHAAAAQSDRKPNTAFTSRASCVHSPPIPSGAASSLACTRPAR